MKTVTTVQENAEDILADAKNVNELRVVKAEACEFEDVDIETEQNIEE